MERRPRIIDRISILIVKIVTYMMISAPLVIGIVFSVCGLYIFLGTTGVVEMEIADTGREPYVERMEVMCSSVVFMAIGLIITIIYSKYIYKVFKKSKSLEDKNFDETTKDVIEYK